MRTISIRQELTRLGSTLGYPADGAVFEDVDRVSPGQSTESALSAPTYMSLDLWKDLGRPVFINVEVKVADE